MVIKTTYVATVNVKNRHKSVSSYLFIILHFLYSNYRSLLHTSMYFLTFLFLHIPVNVSRETRTDLRTWNDMEIFNSDYVFGKTAILL